MDKNTHLICESVQEITLAAWPVIYGNDNKYDIDSRVLLETFRNWGEEFEDWWMSHDEDWIDSHDYLEEIYDFADKKIGAYLRAIVGWPGRNEAVLR